MGRVTSATTIGTLTTILTQFALTLSTNHHNPQAVAMDFPSVRFTYFNQDNINVDKFNGNGESTVQSMH